MCGHIGAKELMTLVNSAPTMKLSLPLADIPIALGERKDYRRSRKAKHVL